MQREPRRTWPVFGWLLLLVASACAPAEKEKPVEAAKPKPPEVDPRALCGVVAEVEDARARGTLDATVGALEARMAEDPADRAAAFGALYAIPDEQERWRAFKQDREEHPESALGHLGECFIYAAWKVPDQARVPCETASARLRSLALVDVARGDLASNRGDATTAAQLYEAALAVDGACVPALVRLARLKAEASPSTAVSTYEKALGAKPDCFLCAFEKAALLEQSEGMEAAISSWEAALALAPEHPTLVKRYAAAQAGRDDAAALAAYEKAISLGVNDVATFIAAATLAERAGEVAKALSHAQAAAAVQADDVEIWRLVASLAEKSEDASAAATAHGEVLRLAPEDAPAHLALARASVSNEQWLDALTHLESAVASLESPEEAERKAAAEAELLALLDKLFVRKAGTKGNVNRVVAVVQGDVRKLFEERKKEKRGLAGLVAVTVITREDGSVREVSIAKDTLEDPMVAAALVGNLRRATIVGGAKRYNFELEFQ